MNNAFAHTHEQGITAGQLMCARGAHVSALPRRPIPANGADLWFVHTDEVRNQTLLARCHALLSEDEKHQQQRFHFEHDRHRYLLTRAALRMVLSRYWAADPEQWRFVSNGYGKPRIVNEAIARELSFNVSHTAGLILIGVSGQDALGVDVENITPPVSLDVADHFFAPSEARAMRSMPVERQPMRFFELWTLKEAYIKARGMGLSIPLHQFHFDLDTFVRGIEISFEPALADRSSRWSFMQFAAGPRHLVAACLPAAGAAPTLCAIRFVPDGTEQAFDLSLSRASRHRQPDSMAGCSPCNSWAESENESRANASSAGGCEPSLSAPKAG